MSLNLRTTVLSPQFYDGPDSEPRVVSTNIELSLQTNLQLLCCWPLYPQSLPSLENTNHSLLAFDPSQPPSFSPWKPGDAYGPNKEDWPPFPPFMGAWQYGDQIRSQ